MSRQSEAKKRQNYNPKPDHAKCSNCIHFASVIEKLEGYEGFYEKEKGLMCTFGGFAVKKQGTCTEHIIKI